MVRVFIILVLLLSIYSILAFPVTSSSSYVPGWPLSIRVLGYNYNDTTHELTISLEIELPNPGYIIGNTSIIHNESGYYVDFEILKTTNPVIQVVTYKYVSVKFENVSRRDFPLEVNILVNHKPYSVVEIDLTSSLHQGVKPSTVSNEGSSGTSTSVAASNTSSSSFSSNYSTVSPGSGYSRVSRGRYVYIIALIIGLFTFAAAILFIGRK